MVVHRTGRNRAPRRTGWRGPGRADVEIDHRKAVCFRQRLARRRSSARGRGRAPRRRRSSAGRGTPAPRYSSAARSPAAATSRDAPRRGGVPDHLHAAPVILHHRTGGGVSQPKPPPERIAPSAASHSSSTSTLERRDGLSTEIRGVCVESFFRLMSNAALHVFENRASRRLASELLSQVGHRQKPAILGVAGGARPQARQSAGDRPLRRVCRSAARRGLPARRQRDATGWRQSSVSRDRAASVFVFSVVPDQPARARSGRQRG